MGKITKQQYEFALRRVEELLPLVDETMSKNDPAVVELSMMSDFVIEYEKEHFPIEKPTVAELISCGLQEVGISQKQLAMEIGVSPSRISDFTTGRAEPSLRIAGKLCSLLHISPSAMLML
ncbi:MAG: helix-turn-helix transcriptional regulator [Bacteroidales bacterium]|nr:helix-turn-helix transcriptional regulator [Bacteroidales bacterium]